MRTSSGWSTLFRSTFSREGCPFASFIHKRVLYWEVSTARKPSAKQYMYLAVVMEPNHWDSMLRTVVVASCIDTVSWWSPVVVIPGCYLCFEINLNHWGVAKISKGQKREKRIYTYICRRCCLLQLGLRCKVDWVLSWGFRGLYTFQKQALHNLVLFTVIPSYDFTSVCPSLPSA
jgi:hypothetical protein